jgi:hypothetical protein
LGTDKLKDMIRKALPGKSDEELAEMEKLGTLEGALRESPMYSSPKAGSTPAPSSGLGMVVTKEAKADLTRGTDLYGMEGLSSAQKISIAKMPRMLVERYVKAYAFEKSAVEKAGKTPKLDSFADIAAKPFKGVPGGFMWTMDVVDRFTQDWMFAVADDLFTGGKSPEDIWKRVHGVLKGDEHIEFAQVLDNLPREHKRALAEGLMAAKIAFQGVDLPHQFQGVENVLESLLPGQTKEDATWENARKVYGFMGDMTLDASLIGGGVGMGLRSAAAIPKLSRASKVLTVASHVADPMHGAGVGLKKGADAALAELSKHDKLNKALRTTFIRGTGLKELDREIDTLSSLEPYLRDKMMGEASKVYKDMKPLLKKGYSVHVLAEERNFDEVLSLAGKVAAGEISFDDIADHRSFTFVRKNFSNPREAKKTVQMLSNNFAEDADELARHVGRYRDFWENSRNIRIAYGVSPDRLGSLTGKMERKHKRLLAQHKEAFYNAIEETKRSTAKRIEDSRVAIDRNKIVILEAGERGTKSFMQDMATKQNASVDDFMRAYRSEFSHAVAKSILDNKDHLSAIEYLQRLQSSHRYLVSQASKDPIVLKLQKDIIDLRREIAKSPNYVPHMATKDGLEAMNRFGERFPRGSRFSNVAAEDIHREWSTKLGRALSHEEIEDRVRSGMWKHGGQEGKFTSLADAAKFEPGPIYKKDHFGTKILKKFRKNDTREIADLFEVDPATILATGSRNTARSAAAANFWSELITPGSPYIRETLDDLSPRDKKIWVKLGSLPGGEQVVLMQPDLGKLWVQRRAAAAMLDASRPFMKNGIDPLAIRAIDSMKKWWISYTLPLYPAYHSRNAFGNFFNMTHAGFAMDPRYFSSDVTSWYKAKHLQFLGQFKDHKGSSNIRFPIKGFKDGISGDEMHKLASRVGVLDSGFLSTELDAVFQSTSMANNWSSWVPGSQNWHMVRYGREAGRWIENSDRLALFASQLARGKSIEDSAAITKKFLGNFNNMMMTPFERQFMQRMFPFWRWMRFNIPLQFEQLMFNPMARYRMTNLRRIHENFFEPEGLQDGMLPGWASTFVEDLGSVSTGFNPESGEMRFNALEGWLPAADIGNIVGALDSKNSISRFALQSSFPLVKMFAESAIGVPSIGEPEPFEGETQEFLGMRMPRQAVAILRNIRFLNELDRNDPFSSFVGPNSVLKFHKDRKELEASEKLIRALGGLGTYYQNPNAEILKMRYDQMEQIGIAKGAAIRTLEERAKDMSRRAKLLREAEAWLEDAEKRFNKQLGKEK